jgi:type II secretory pathway component PulC
MKSLRVLNWKTVRYFCGLALAAIVVYFAANLSGFYPDGGGENNAVSSKSHALAIQQKQPEKPSLNSNKKLQEKNPTFGTTDVQENAPTLEQASAAPAEEPNWEDRSSLGYAQAKLRVRLKPFYQGGNQDGFEVKSIHGDSPLKPIGLENGDIIKSINGEPIDSDLDILQIHDAINNGDSYTISVVRDGQPITLSSKIK